MIVMKRAMLFFLLAVSLGLIVYMGIRGYLITGDVAALSMQDRKFQAETFIYISIVFAILFIFLYAAVLLRSRNLYRELDRLIELTRFGNISIEDTLKKIGRLGEKIRRLYYQLNEINEKRSLKISALSRINEFLMNNIDLACLIMDATGKIMETSRRYLENTQVERDDVVGKYITTLMPEISFEDVFQQLDRERNTLDMGTKEPTTFVPIFNRTGELSQIICVMGKEKLLTGPAGEKVEKISRFKRVTGFFKSKIQQR